MYKGAKVMIEEPDGMFADFDNRQRRFTSEEFEKLKALQGSEYGWIIIKRPSPEQITNPSYVPYEEKSIEPYQTQK